MNLAQRAFRIGATSLAVLAIAAEAAAAQPGPPPPPATKPGSVFVQCDGLPAHRTAGETAARLVAILLTMGVSGPGELADLRKRTQGEAAVAACTKALAGESDTVRRLQLTLALALHELEAKRPDDALKDIRSIDAMAAPVAADTAWTRQFRLSAIELEAYALAAQGHAEGAAAAAIRMTELSPWDGVAYLRAHRFVVLSWGVDPAKRAYLDRYAKLFPSGLALRAHALEQAGDFRGAGETLAAWVEGKQLFFKSPATEPVLKARAALDFAMAGDMSRAEAWASKARAAIDSDEANGKAAGEASVIGSAAEDLDLLEVVKTLAAGRAAEARIAFSARSRWVDAGAGVLSILVDRLRAGAAPGELKGPLARDGASVRAESLAGQLKSIQADPDISNAYWGAIRPWQGDDAWAQWTRLVWRVDRSSLIVPHTPKDVYNGDFIWMTDSQGFNGEPAAEALLMHAALEARAHGEPAFLISPPRQNTRGAWVLYGKLGEPGFSEVTTLDAATVIAALSDRFPGPKG